MNRGELAFCSKTRRGSRDYQRVNELVRNKDLEAAHDLCQRDGPILGPVLKGLGVIDEDDEVFILALVVNFALSSVSTRHDGLGMFDLRGRLM